MGKQAIIKAITKLNERADNRILKTFPYSRVQTASMKEINAKGLNVYCENPTLSLSEPGSVFNVLEVFVETRSINDEDRRHLLDVLCCFYDFRGNKPSNTGELRDAWIRAQEKQNELRQIYWPHCIL